MNRENSTWWASYYLSNPISVFDCLQTGLAHSLSISNYNVNVTEWLFDRDDLNKKKKQKKVEFVMWSFHVSDYSLINLLFNKKIIYT